MNYRGPISAVILITDAGTDIPKVEAAVRASKALQDYADIHLYRYHPAVNGEDFPRMNDELTQADTDFLNGIPLYPANLMRDLAVENARSTWIITAEAHGHCIGCCIQTS